VVDSYSLASDLKVGALEKANSIMIGVTQQIIGSVHRDVCVSAGEDFTSLVLDVAKSLHKDRGFEAEFRFDEHGLCGLNAQKLRSAGEPRDEAGLIFDNAIEVAKSISKAGRKAGKESDKLDLVTALQELGVQLEMQKMKIRKIELAIRSLIDEVQT